jgi:hypothetical protein
MQQYIREIIHHNQVGFNPWMQWWFNKIEHHFMIKALRKLGIGGM